MADLTITAADVGVANSINVPDTIIAGEDSIDHGDILRLDPTTGKYVKASSLNKTTSGGDDETSVVFALQSGDTDDSVLVLRPGSQIKIGVSTTIGTTLYLSDVAGNIADDDPGVGEFVTILGVTIGDGILDFKPRASGVAVTS